MNNEIEKLKSQVEQIQKTISDLEKKEKKKCYQIKKVNFGEEYYTVDGWFTVQKQINRDWEPDFYYYRSFNYFNNEKEARKYCNHLGWSTELFRIRDMINGIWKPNWNDKNEKFSIILRNNKIFIQQNNDISSPFTFKTIEKANEFLSVITEDILIKCLSF